jgi:diphthamide biosynthesis protein 7
LATPSAILDIHFAPLHFPPSLFAVATSTGSISLYHLTDEYGNGLDTRKLIQSATSVPRLSHIKTCQFFSEDVLITAFSWHPLHPSVGVTLSSGEVCIAIVDVYPQTTFPPSDLIRAHDLEAWTLAFVPDASGVFSGGDDSVLGFAELPTGAEEPRLMPWLDRKIHGAGVTAILPLQVTEEGVLVLTGSYDDHIRLVHASATGRRRVLAEGNLGGGVWRLKRLDSEPGVNDVLLLVSCMHAGARIVKLHRDESREWQFEVLAKFEEHKSMNYGSDSQPTLNEQGQRTFITTSFYDRLLCLWRY